MISIGSDQLHERLPSLLLQGWPFLEYCVLILHTVANSVFQTFVSMDVNDVEDRIHIHGYTNCKIHIAMIYFSPPTPFKSLSSNLQTAHSE